MKVVFSYLLTSNRYLSLIPLADVVMHATFISADLAL